MQGLRDYAGHDEIERGLRQAAAETGAWVCVTDGENGVTWLKDGELGHVPAFRVEVVDTLAAGDVWHGAFALCLGAGMGEVAAIRFANAVAAIKCTRLGGRAGVPNRADAESFIRKRS